MRHEASPNHAYVLQTALRLALPAAHPRILDFGCGSGFLVDMARRGGHDFWGADAFPGKWANWVDRVRPDARPFVHCIEGGQLPFPDAHFDVVVTNFVFEHVPGPDLGTALREIRRVLKPGGSLLALFPTRDVWFEGHLGVYLPHRLDRTPSLQYAYLWICRRLGFGYRAHGKAAAAWATSKQENLRINIHYYRMRDIRSLCAEIFGDLPRSLAPDYMRFRLGPRVPRIASILRSRTADPILRLICHKRAGRILAVSRSR